MREKIIKGTLLTGLILLGIYLYNLGQRPDREYPSFTLHPEKKAATVHDSIPLRDVVQQVITGTGSLPFLTQILLKS